MSKTLSGNYTSSVTLTGGNDQITVTGKIVVNAKFGVALSAPGGQRQRPRRHSHSTGRL
jgi:hypothetical protein